MKEKRFILINKIAFLVIFLLNIFLPIVLSSFQSKIELVDDNVYCEYDETSGYSYCEVELTFNKSISSGEVTIHFYDDSDNLITSEDAYFYIDGTVVTDKINLYGEVDGYELDGLDFDTALEFLDFVYLLYYFLPITLTLLICSLFLNYKKYEYKGYIIEIYAGYGNHYIKINGEKFDEYKSSLVFSPIVLSCTLDSGEKMKATISLTNRISLKINDKLYSN